MKKIVLSLVLTIFVLSFANAQDYKTAVGLRGGWGYGLTIKHFLGEKSAVEGLLSSRWSGFEITGLYEIHNPAFEVDRLKWFYGVGGHLGSYGSSYLGGTGIMIGVDGILGLDYSFTEFPINISVDWKPSFNIIGYSHFYPDGGAFSIRYTF
ncbi:MAG: hypothetical protein MUC93_11315 [Bacteroidales bacterium]|jgi:hypothetical protein|nr:hypothetical protein [Bacteroidales bacterium]